MELTTFWFVVIAVLWTGYFFLEGFDFGVGMLLRLVGRDENGKRVMINTIGPVWDANEVWLLTAGGATFAAFPNWYATLFSGFYLPLFLVLVALILRGVAFEYRGKVDSDRWRAWWDRAILFGSWVPAVVWGVAFANIVRGVPIDRAGDFTGSLLSLFNPFALLGGATTALLFAWHGANFVVLKTEAGDPVHDRAARLCGPLGLATIVVAATFLVTNQIARGAVWTWVPVAVAALALIGSVVARRAGRDGWAFVGTGLAIAAAVVALFGGLFPDVMPSTTDPAFSLTVKNASSTPYTLRIMTWVAVVMTPVVVAYQAWSYWIFRKRIGSRHLPKVHAAPAPA
jgi:cytochrome d ubiquinol oxidase subunit II